MKRLTYAQKVPVWRKLNYLPNPLQRPGHEPEEDPGTGLDAITMISGGWRSGKALRVDTPIQTPKGWVAIGELKAGEQVYGVSGEPIGVTAVSPVWKGRECYGVDFSDGTSIVADAEHDWVTVKERKYCLRTTKQLANDLSKGEVLLPPSIFPGALTVVSVGGVEYADTICIEVDTPDHMFLAGEGMVPTHNSVWLAGEAVPHALIPSPRPYLGAFIGPTYTEPREEMGYIRDWLASFLPSRQFDIARDCSWPQDGKVQITIPSQRTPDGDIHFATLKSYTADEAMRIRAFNADFMVICEAGGISEEAFYNIMGRVLSTGGFVIGSGTLEFSLKWYHNMIKEGMEGVSERGVRSFILPSWANTIEFPGGREDPKIKRIENILPPDMFQVRCGGLPVRLIGVAVQEASTDHIKDVEFSPALPVELAIDPGYTGAYSVLALQYYDNQVRIIDEVYQHFLSTPEVIEICKQRPWWGFVDQSNPGVIDRAAKQHSSTDGMSVLELWYQEAGLWLDLTEATIPIDTGLEQLRVHLNMDGRIAVAPKVHGLLAEWDLGQFPEGFEDSSPWQYTKASDGGFRGDQKLTGANHSTTALIYWLVNRFGFVTEEMMKFESRSLRPWREPETYGVYNYDGTVIGRHG